jgi:hypothetical protein
MSDNAIVVDDLAKRFGEVVALDGIDFQVPAGSVFGLLGPTAPARPPPSASSPPSGLRADRGPALPRAV